ncbi:MAG: phosphodiester glycosidase family protein [Aphanocapsa sp. GSE-SYN-MK-11-07L]|nr:phosphodiester glycosidase family protein [Aphanocapsa sp. GSE-SYN-MK-11-07L]
MTDPMPRSRQIRSWLTCCLSVGLSYLLLPLASAQPEDGAIPPPLPSPPAAQPNLPSPQLMQGTQLTLNGRNYAVGWGQWQGSNGQVVTGISDVGLMSRFGLNLANSNNPSQQPVDWFSDQQIPLSARLGARGIYRYLEINSLAQQFNWQIQAQGNLLQINTPAARITGLRLGRQAWGERLVIDLDRPTPWQISRLTNSRDAIAPRELALTLEATIDPKLAAGLKARPGGGMRTLGIDLAARQTVIKSTLAGHLRPEVSMLANPPRLIVDIRPQATQNRDILWASGLRWREQTVSIGARQYPVTWLEVNPRQPGLKLEPIWGQTLVGIQPLASIAQRWQAAAAINGGFFNRDQQLPLGAIRQNGAWISSPILNRGAIAWNEAGEFKVGRLMLQQTLLVGTQRVPLVSLDSGFVEKGIARYTPNWGATYTPRIKAETVITVVDDQVVGQQPASGNMAITIPRNGYLLALRDAVLPLAPGTTVQIELGTAPAAFERFPNILGAGPLLLEQGRIVLNAAAEQFGKGLDAQAAPRSGIGQRADGMILIVTTHNRMGGPGPTLPEWAQIMQRLGVVDGINLDGGSSTALYLGGRLIDRHSVTTTRVQNGIGIFLQPQQ